MDPYSLKIDRPISARGFYSDCFHLMCRMKKIPGTINGENKNMDVSHNRNKKVRAYAYILTITMGIFKRYD